MLIDFGLISKNIYFFQKSGPAGGCLHSHVQYCLQTHVFLKNPDPPEAAYTAMSKIFQKRRPKSKVSEFARLVGKTLVEPARVFCPPSFVHIARLGPQFNFGRIFQLIILGPYFAYCAYCAHVDKLPLLMRVQSRIKNDDSRRYGMVSMKIDDNPEN